MISRDIAKAEKAQNSEEARFLIDLFRRVCSIFRARVREVHKLLKKMNRLRVLLLVLRLGYALDTNQSNALVVWLAQTAFCWLIFLFLGTWPLQHVHGLGFFL
jgi:hypothetical protein